MLSLCVHCNLYGLLIYLCSCVCSVTSKKLPNVYKSCLKRIYLVKWKIVTPLQKLPKMCWWFGQNNYCPGLWKVAQSIKNRPILSHCVCKIKAQNGGDWDGPYFSFENPFFVESRLLVLVCCTKIFFVRGSRSLSLTHCLFPSQTHTHTDTLSIFFLIYLDRESVCACLRERERV